MTLTENELSVAYCSDNVIHAAVVANELSGDQWDMHHWYASRIGYVYPERMMQPVSGRLILAFRADVLKLMREHNRFTGADEVRASAYLDALYATIRELHDLGESDPRAYRVADREFVAHFAPAHLMPAYDAGTLLCEDLARVTPRAFLPFVADL